MNEAQTRLNLNDPAIRAAGWTEENDCHVLVEQTVAPGRVGKVRGKPLRADYILCHRGRRLVVVEAKGDEHQAIEGYEQALKYGRMLGVQVAYATNGREILEIDLATRRELLAKLAENGFEMERLKELQKLMDSEDCDLLDVLEYVAFEVPMQKRVERAGAARKGLSHWVTDEHAKGFYTFVLDNYVQEGVDVFTRDDALSQLIVPKYHTIDDARSTLGNLAVIRTGFATLQRAVYAA